jgi:hypothetical protein
MNSYDVAQMGIVIIAVLASSLYMLGRIAPGWRNALSQRLQRNGYPRWVNAVGVRIASGGGCGSGCSSCDSCPSNTAKK